MALITLAQAKVGMSNKYDQYIIDQTQRGSMLLDMLPFDDAVSPGTGGSTMAYSYVNLKTPSQAGFRALNTEYVSKQAVRESKTVDIKILGGQYEVDRLLVGTSGAVDELQFQIDEKILAVKNEFHNGFINGDKAAEPLEFDGLNALLTGSSTEFNTGSAIDLSTSELMESNHNEFIDLITASINKLKGKPSLMLMNNDMLSKMESVARRAGYFSQTEDAFGETATTFKGIPMVDMEKYHDGTDDVDVIGTDPTSKETSIYFIVINGKRGVIGITPNGSNIIRSYTPDLNLPGVMKKGDVELPTAIVLKDSRSAGVVRRIKIG